MKIKSLLAASTALVLSADPACALTIFSFDYQNGCQTLLSFDSSGGNINTIGLITGTNAPIIDIDFSPVNGQLYGLSSAGDLYQIDTITGSAALSVNPTPGFQDVPNTIDFNPVADRLRVFGSSDSNYRLTPDATAFNNIGLTAGQLTFDGNLISPTVQIVGAAYTNSFDGVASTTLYSIDNVQDSLLIHSGGPQFNTTTLVGLLGTSVNANSGFDIGQDGIAYLTDGFSANIYTVDLSTGTASSGTALTGTFTPRGIAVAPIPEPGSALLLFVASSLALRRRRTAA